MRHAIVHNRTVVEGLKAKGAIFVEELDEVPPGAVVIFSAHGVPQKVVAEAEARGLRHLNARCPLVTKVRREVERHAAIGRHVILVGHEGHPEIIGTTGQVPEGVVTVVGDVDEVASLPFTRDRPLAYVTQTTFALDELAAITAALNARYTNFAGPNGHDVCYATTNRQAEVRAIAPEVATEPLWDLLEERGSDRRASNSTEAPRARTCAMMRSHASMPFVGFVDVDLVDHPHEVCRDRNGGTRKLQPDDHQRDKEVDDQQADEAVVDPPVGAVITRSAATRSKADSIAVLAAPSRGRSGRPC